MLLFYSVCVCVCVAGKDDRLKKLSERRYWANKYQDLDSPFDWFLSEEVVSSFVCHTLLNVASKRNFHEKSKRMFNRVQPVNVLDLGCGKSSLPLYFYEWTPFPVAIHCLDYVHEAVDFQLKNLRAAPAGHPGSYVCGVCASVCHLPYQSDHFHLVTDKGTMDAVLKDPANGSDRARAMLKEVERVLKSGGSFMQVTDEDPDSRMYFLERHSPANCNWGFSILIDHSTNSKECFVYSFCK
ncbi:hypothetical protein ACOMHN_033136 [Nucella lapillus]